MDRPTVLVVDDDPAIRDFLADLLTLEEFRVETAADGLDGLAALQHCQPDVMLVDVMMPRMDGPSFVRAARAGHTGRRWAPVVLMSAAPGLAESAAGLNVDYIAKPFLTLEALLAKVRQCLQRSASRPYASA